MAQSIIHRIAAAATIVGTATLLACELPLGGPIFEQTWVVPSAMLNITAEELLPEGVSVTRDPSPSFLLAARDVSHRVSLADMCGVPACESPFEFTAGTPAFRTTPGTLAASVVFPRQVSAVTVASGALHLTITNDLGFDPLRPNGASTAPYGRMHITMSSGTAPVERTDVVGSETVGLPDGETTTLVFPLPRGVYSDSLTIDIELDVPIGAPATLGSQNGIMIALSVQNLGVSQVMVALVDEPVVIEPTELKVSDVDFREEVAAGALLLTAFNPFTASAALEVIIDVPAQGDAAAIAITKELLIPSSPASDARIEFTRDELRALLGKRDVTIRLTGLANGTGPLNTLTLTPLSMISVRPLLEIVLRMGK